MTVAAALNVHPPTNTDSCANTSRSAGVSSSWLHSIAPYMDCCRGDAVRDPPARMPKDVSSSDASSSMVITLVRAAANSIASGIPSSRRTTLATWSI